MVLKHFTFDPNDPHFANARPGSPHPFFATVLSPSASPQVCVNCTGNFAFSSGDNPARAESEEEDEIEFGQIKKFSLRQLQVATDHFSPNNILRQDESRRVYKGRLPDGSLAEVNRLRHTGHQNEVFQTELELSSLAVHRNILKLRGFCKTRKELLLVYPYMANGSAASLLRERRYSQPALEWPIRKRIALGVAKGLTYLHEHCKLKIIHRDLKAANILLDDDYEAVVRDFGLAILLDHRETHVTTALRGTTSHIAPEYLSTLTVSDKTDVFGYGIMLLELITGQRAFDLARLANDEDVMLLDWVKWYMSEGRPELQLLVDFHIRRHHFKEVEQLVQVALFCTQSSASERPTMSEVVRMLQGGDRLAERWEQYWNRDAMLVKESSQEVPVNRSQPHPDSTSSPETRENANLN